MKALRYSFWGFTILFFLWLAGISWFTASTLLMQPQRIDEATGAIVALTGGSNHRIKAGLDLFAARRGLYLFITGVHPSTDVEGIQSMWSGSIELPSCCIVLDNKARTTLGNAMETRVWIETTDITSIRLVTSDYHMTRAMMEMSHALPGVEIIPHPIHQPGMSFRDSLFWRLIVSEYHKTLFRAPYLLLRRSRPLMREAP